MKRRHCSLGIKAFVVAARCRPSDIFKFDPAGDIQTIYAMSRDTLRALVV
jgi:hypothetical protein